MKDSRKLTLHIDGRRITAERFRRAMDAFFDLVADVSEAVTGEAKAIDWVVSVTPGSINVGAVGEPRRDHVPVHQVVHAVYSGVQELARNAPSRPEFFSDNALEKTRDLIKLQDGKGVSTIQVRKSRNRVTLNDKVLVSIERILGGSLTELGTLEGRLKMISAQGGLHIGIWDAITERAVRCNIAPRLEGSALAAFNRRVAVSGKIRYRPSGEPVSIDAEHIEIFPDANKLPTAEEVYGILSKA